MLMVYFMKIKKTITFMTLKKKKNFGSRILLIIYFLFLGSLGREFKQDCSYERQILRWIEKHGNKGVTLSEISRAFRFTTDGSLEGVLKKLISLNYLTKSYCDRGRTKVFRYLK